MANLQQDKRKWDQEWEKHFYEDVMKGKENKQQYKDKKGIILQERIFTKWISFLPSLW